MSIGGYGGIPASVAGAPLAQSSGTEQDRGVQETDSHSRSIETEIRAEKSAGISPTDGEDHDPAKDRGPDGRQAWQLQDQRCEEATEEAPLSKDPNGEKGNELDLRG
jgi:hypothetical protein